MSSSVALQIIAVVQTVGFNSIFVMFGFGVIGNILNILVFTKLSIYQGNPCAFYLVIESILNMEFLNQVFIRQLSQIIFGIDPYDKFVIYCKLDAALSRICLLLIVSIVCFQAFDQYLSTHYQSYLRNLSTIKFARYSISITAIICTLQTIPNIIFYDIVPQFGCIVNNKGLEFYNSFLYMAVLHGILPILICCSFSLLAYRNVRRIIRRQIPIIRRRLDQQLTAMIFVRVIVFIILLLPVTMLFIYLLLIDMTKLDLYSWAILQLMVCIAYLLAYLNYSVNFYLFFFASSRFRRQVKYFITKRCWKSLKNCFHPNKTRINPVNTILVNSAAELE